MNNKIEPTYVSFEQVKWLKEKGFDVPCKQRFWVGFENEEHFQNDCISNNWNDYDDSSTIYYSAPEQWQVVEWLRVNHGIWVYLEIEDDMSTFTWNCVYKMKNAICKDYDEKFYNSPQSAYAAAFDYIRKNNLI